MKFKLFLPIYTLVISLFAQNSFGYEVFYRNDDFAMTTTATEIYSREVQPILDIRCATCHSCKESPCGLTLTSPEGVQRGAHHKSLLPGAFTSGIRSKIFHDGKNENDWRSKGFYSVTRATPIMRNQGLNSGNSSVFAAAILNKMNPLHVIVSANLLDTEINMCKEGLKDLNLVPAMPYKMTSLTQEETETLMKWINSDDPEQILQQAIDNPDRARPKNPFAIKAWEDFFNHPTNRAKWTSRYLYEKLFLARFYIQESPGEFYELVRSHTPSGQEIDVISTLKAFDKPADKFYYRLFKVRSTLMNKDHFIYEVSYSELEHLKNLFWNAKWTKKDSEIPFNFNETNPLIAFRFIPAKSRYNWMLENAKLLLDISARAQNCRSIGAGAPYWDNMLHIFLKPEADVTVMNDDFADQAGHLLRIPRTTNGRHHILERFLSDQMEYSKIKQQMLKNLRPQGFLLEDVWDGVNGENKNAIVTVLRHEWTASAHQGQMGSTPRSVLLLDYALFERYFYLCNVATEITEPGIQQGAVVNYLFDVKKEAEDQFLSFIEEKQRRSIRQNLVQGFNVDKEFGPQFSLPQNPESKKIEFQNNDVYDSFIKNFLTQKFKPSIIGVKSHIIPNPTKNLSSISKEIRSTLDSSEQQLFAAYLPNVSYLLVLDQGKIEYFSLLANRYHSSRNRLSLIDNTKYDKSTRVADRDVIEVYDGIEANFPEKFYIVKSENLTKFLQDMKKLRNRQEFLVFNSNYGLDQNQKYFWNYMDAINSFFIRTNPIEGGIIDLHKYGSVDLVAPQ